MCLKGGAGDAIVADLVETSEHERKESNSNGSKVCAEEDLPRDFAWFHYGRRRGTLNYNMHSLDELQMDSAFVVFERMWDYNYSSSRFPSVFTKCFADVDVEAWLES